VAAWLGVSLPALATEPPAATPANAPGKGLSPGARERFIGALATLRSGDPNVAASEFGDPHWASTPLAAYALLFQAESLLQAGNNAGARGEAQRAASPEGRLAPSALLRAAAVLSNAGDNAGAATLLRRFLAQNVDHPGAARARLMLGQALLA